MRPLNPLNERLYNREKNYFRGNPSISIYDDYVKSVDEICRYRDVGLIASWSFEYPLFPMLRKRQCPTRIHHVMEESQLQDVEALFFLDDECRFGLCRPPDRNPAVIYHRSLPAS